MSTPYMNTAGTSYVTITGTGASSGGTYWIGSATTASWPWASREELTNDEVRRCRRLLSLLNATDDELAEMAEGLAGHAGVTPDVARATLNILKAMLVLGELQAKMEGKR